MCDWVVGRDVGLRMSFTHPHPHISTQNSQHTHILRYFIAAKPRNQR